MTLEISNLVTKNSGALRKPHASGLGSQMTLWNSGDLRTQTQSDSGDPRTLALCDSGDLRTLAI